MRHKKAHPALVKVVLAIILLHGVVMLVVGGILFVHSVAFVSAAVGADATVSHVESEQTVSGGADQVPGVVYRPTFTFQDTSGQQHTVKLDHASSSYDFRVGEQMEILYDPDDPQRLRIRSFSGTWLFPAWFLGFGVGAIGVFCVVRAAARRGRRTT